MLLSWPLYSYSSSNCRHGSASSRSRSRSRSRTSLSLLLPGSYRDDLPLCEIRVRHRATGAGGGAGDDAGFGAAVDLEAVVEAGEGVDAEVGAVVEQGHAAGEGAVGGADCEADARVPAVGQIERLAPVAGNVDGDVVVQPLVAQIDLERPH